MDEWSYQFWQSLATIAKESDRWWQDFNTNLVHATEAFVQTTDEWADQVQQTLEPEVERLVDDIQQLMEPWEATITTQVEEASEHLEQVVDPMVTSLIAGLDQWIDEISGPINSAIDPIMQDQPACVGCRHYYGQAHGGHLLVCAMHPYGSETERCPDWASFWPPQSDSNG